MFSNAEYLNIERYTLILTNRPISYNMEGKLILFINVIGLEKEKKNIDG